MEELGNDAGMDAPLLHGTRCLVTGAAGFLGGAICSRLLIAGATVTAFGHHRRFDDDLWKHVEWRPGDLADSVAVASALRNKDVVIHLIGTSNPNRSNEDPLGECVSGVISTLGLLDTCRTAGVGKFLFASSGGAVYGIPPSIPISETCGTEPISAYGIGKLTIEKYLALYKRLHGLDYQVLRMANPYGPLQSPFREQGIVAVMIYRALLGEPIEIWGTGDVTRDFIHVDDVASAFVHAAAYAGPQKVMNVGSGEGRGINQIAGEIPSILGLKEIPRHYLPARAADVPSNVLDISLIRRETGWRPRVSWQEGVRRTAEWISSTLVTDR